MRPIHFPPSVSALGQPQRSQGIGDFTAWLPPTKRFIRRIQACQPDFGAREGYRADHPDGDHTACVVQSMEPFLEDMRAKFRNVTEVGLRLFWSYSLTSSYHLKCWLLFITCAYFASFSITFVLLYKLTVHKKGHLNTTPIPAYLNKLKDVSRKI